MLEDIRNHDAAPTAEEGEWMRVDIVGAAESVAAMLALALALGIGVSWMVDYERESSAVVVVSQPPARR